MPDDGNKLMQIERGIDRQVAGAMEIARTGGGFGVVAPRNVGELMEFAKMMAVSGVCVRPFLRGNPGACLAITMQAMKWGADPFAVANKAYLVKNKSGDEQLAYEAQLVHAVINTSPALTRRLRARYEGEGQDRRCTIIGYVVGEDEPLEYPSPPIKQIGVKNSPLWVSDPDQQLHYYSARAWARRHLPEILLGIYTPDEFQGQTIELEPQPEPRRQDFAPPEHLRETGRYYDVTDLDGEVHTFSDPHKSVAALRVVLSDASRRDAEALDEVWELNDGLIGDLDERLRSELAGEYTELRDRVIETAQRAVEAQVRASSARIATEREVPGIKSNSGPVFRGDENSQQQVQSAISRGEISPNAARQRTAELSQEPPELAEAADPELTGDDAELDALDRAARVDHELSPPSEQTSQRATSSPAAAEHPEQGEGATSPQPSPARDERAADPTTVRDAPRATNVGRGSETSRVQMEADQANSAVGRGQTATSGASPSDGAEVRKSALIPIPLKGGTGKPDHRTWAVALFLPKVRRQTDGNELAWLLGDNAEAVEICRNGGLSSDDLREFEAAIKAAWERCE